MIFAAVGVINISISVLSRAQQQTNTQPGSMVEDHKKVSKNNGEPIAFDSIMPGESNLWLKMVEQKTEGQFYQNWSISMKGKYLDLWESCRERWV